MSDVAAILRTYPWLASPTDGSRLVAADGALQATGDGTRYPVEDGIPRLLTPTARATAAAADADLTPPPGKQDLPLAEPTLLKMLPYATRPEEGPGMWLRKRAAWEQLERFLDDAGLPPQMRAVDAGAGVGWVARRLSLLGAYALALDASTEARYGLGGALRMAGDAQAPFLPVQADLARPPVLPESADLVVFCDSLPPASALAETLTRHAATLRPGGLLVLVDSPIAPEATDRDTDDLLLTRTAVDTALAASGLAVREWYEPEQSVPRLLERFTRRRADRAPDIPRPFIVARKE